MKNEPNTELLSLLYSKHSEVRRKVLNNKQLLILQVIKQAGGQAYGPEITGQVDGPSQVINRYLTDLVEKGYITKQRLPDAKHKCFYQVTF